MRTIFNQFGFADDERTAFVSGDCGYLALALSKETGWNLVGLSHPDAAAEDYWYHLAVQMPDGKILDINGAWTEDEFLDLWASETYEVAIYSRNIEDATAWTHKRAPKYPAFDPSAYALQVLDRLELPVA